jgi:hypothetical protein
VTELTRALARLERTDRRLRAAACAYHTLDPEREQPSPLHEIAERLVESGRDVALAAASCDALERIASSQLENFPDNLFWDFDYIAACLWAPSGDSSLSRLRAHEQTFVRLLCAFGRNSPIRFRYVHDFVYGLDWERWVKRDPARHGAVGPFDRRFLRRVLWRGCDIRRRIERGDDADFPKLAKGQWRNPFAFSREPEHELRLHRDLARREAIPVPSWRLCAAPDFSKPFTQIRLLRARELGIPGDYGTWCTPG